MTYTHTQTNIRTFRLIESIGPEGRCFEKQSLSTLKRNSLRKKLFLEKKAKEKQAGTQPVGSPAQSPEVAFKCDQCESVCESKDNLEKHIDKNSYKEINML